MRERGRVREGGGRVERATKKKKRRRE